LTRIGEILCGSLAAAPLVNSNALAQVTMLGYGGKISVVGRSGGGVPEFNTATLFFRRNRIGGVAVSDYTPQQAQTAWAEIVSRLNAAGQKPVIDTIFPFEVPK
jgi:NADPH2:quinone reductase